MRSFSVVKSTFSFTILVLILLGFSPITGVYALSNFSQTSTPIKHLIIIFQENVSFDHYFATYPKAANPPGEPHFHASPDTPSVNGLTSVLLTNNTNQFQPFRFDRSRSVTCDMKHAYTSQQNEANGGLMNGFVGHGSPNPQNCSQPNRLKQVMGYYDGNTVTALWNYAQYFAMSDNFFGSTFGPSTPGALNLISGQTHGAIPTNIKGVVNGTVIGNPNPQPTNDDCSDHTIKTIVMSGKNIGDRLNEKNVTWGWFSDGFIPSIKSANGEWHCLSSSKGTVLPFNSTQLHDYYPTVEPFQYYNSTANPHHLSPISMSMVGRSDKANHQYNLTMFWRAAEKGNLPSVSFIKAATYQQGHPALSNPLDEQTFLVNTINRLQRLPQWNTTAIIVTYDDSGGWYDHVMPPIVSQSNDPVYDRLLGKTGLCGHAQAGAYQDRCGYGPRLPLLVISPYVKPNYVDHSVTDQSSIIRFIEDNWGLKRIGDQSFDAKAGSLLNMLNFTTKHYTKNIFLDPSTGLRK